jgi:hypothetical protein
LVKGGAVTSQAPASASRAVLGPMAAAALLGTLAQLCAPVPPLPDLTAVAGVWIALAAGAGWCAGLGSPPSRPTTPRPTTRRPTTRRPLMVRSAVNGLLALLTAAIAVRVTQGLQHGGADAVSPSTWWSALAIPVGAALGALGCLSRVRGWPGGAAVAVVCGLLVAEAVVLALSCHGRARWGVIGFDLTAAIFALLRTPADHGRRRAALLLLPAVALLGAGALGAAPLLPQVMRG